MNLISYVNEMMSRDSLYSDVCLYILIGFAAFILVGMLLGFLRGAYRQLFHTATFLVTAVLSFAIVKLLLGKIIEALNVNTIGDAITRLQSFTGIDMTVLYEAVLNLDTDGLAEFLILPATVILAPLAFIGIFLVLRFIFAIVSSILIRILRIRRSKGLLERFGGLCLSAVETVLFLSVFLLPFTSVAGFVNDAYAVMIDEDTESGEELTEQYNDIIMPLAKHPAIDIAGRAANTLISSSFTPNGEGLKAKNDLIYTVKIAAVDMPKLLEIDFNAISDEDKALIDRTINDIDHSEFTTAVMASVVKGFAKTLEFQTDLTMEPPLDTVFGDLFATFSTTTSETVIEDLRIIKDLLVFMSENKITATMSEGGDLTPVLTAKDPDTDAPVISGLIDLIKSNERTKHLVTSITKLSISMLKNDLTADSEQLDVTYDNIKNDVSEILSTDESGYKTKDEYIDALAGRLDEALTDNGIDLSDDTVRTIAEYVDENFAGKTELTEKEFNDIILSYYNAHIEDFENLIK